jgi:selenide,water dikinase
MDPLEKRKRVMSRSIKLGHCVCDPRKPCPCPVFKAKNICSCAGEREPLKNSRKEVRLTDYVRSAGCASKIGQKDLHEVLKSLPLVQDPRLLVGMATADDAGVFKLTSGVTIVQTVDVFTPGVDDAYTFGRIAACNSLSDVYAMGGTPITALSIIGFPIYSLPHEVMTEILRGGMDVLKEAGTILLGGHSINDEEIKFGFAVTGVVKESDIVTNAGARPGDVLVLTKPLGTGIVSLASQIGKASRESVSAITKSMTTLNRTAAEIMVKHGATACTDITGFGLLGHLAQVVAESKVTVEIRSEDIPVFPGVLEYAQKGMFSGANERNAEYSSSRTTFDAGVSEAMKAILFDAQTSGGLLIFVPEKKAAAMLKELQKRGIAIATVVGRTVGKSKGRIEVRSRGVGGGSRGRSPSSGEGSRLPDEIGGRVSSRAVAMGVRSERSISGVEEKKMSKKAETKCCEHSGGSSDGAIGKFEDFMGAALAPGAIDVVSKELMAISLGLAVHCVPCSKIHIKKALSMGIGKQEMEEAAALAIAFSGCRALMLWNELKKELL